MTAIDNYPDSSSDKDHQIKSSPTESVTESSPDLPMDPKSPASANEFDNINVVVRVRPLHSNRITEKNRDTSLFPAAGQIQVNDPISNTTRSFTFNVVFEPEATQEEIFEHSGVKRLIDMALEGFACTIFAYGQTGSGKTFTLCGNYYEDFNDENKKVPKDQKILGIIQLSFAYLFEQIKLKKDRGVYYVVTASYLEVYNEQVLDLLNPSTKSLNVRWSKDRGFYAENLFKVECEDIGDLEGVLEEGTKNRQVRSHMMNEKSSRSHSLLTISLASETQDPEDPQGYIRREGRLCLVDLAGSEKTKRTQSKGDTLVEANNINRSLLVLGNCISALASPKRRAGHIPYRDSTLTKLLADSLSGSGMTLMVACVSSSPEDASETINTLRYAARAKKVKTNPIVRMDPRELLILSLKREVRLLRMENIYLRQQLNIGSGFILPSNGDRPTSNDSINSQLGENVINQINGNINHGNNQINDKTDINNNNDDGNNNINLNDDDNHLVDIKYSKLISISPNNQLANEIDENINHGNYIVTDSGKLVIKENLLHKYMQQNEGLRAENAQLHQQRERLIHDHELVCRENDRLRKRLSIPSQNGDQQLIPPSTINGNGNHYLENGGEHDDGIINQQEGDEDESEYGDNNNDNRNGLTNGLTNGDINHNNNGINKSSSNNLRREERRPSLVAINGNPEERSIGKGFKFNEKSGNGKLINGNNHNNNLGKGNNDKQSNDIGLELRGTSAATKTRYRRK